jgi:hypothetical protein
MECEKPFGKLLVRMNLFPNYFWLTKTLKQLSEARLEEHTWLPETRRCSSSRGYPT